MRKKVYAKDEELNAKSSGTSSDGLFILRSQVWSAIE